MRKTIKINNVDFTAYFTPVGYKVAHKKIKGPNEGYMLDGSFTEDILAIKAVITLEMSRNVQSGNTQNLKSMVIQRSFPKWSVAERRKTAAASDQAAVCACAHSRYFTGGSPSGLRV